MESIEIPLNKNRVFIGFVVSLLFSAAGFWLLIELPIIKTPIIDGKTLVVLTGILTIFFFGASSIFLMRKLLNIKPGLLIDHLGLIDNSSGLLEKLIIWSDIEKFNEIEIFGRKHIVVHVRNPHDYIEKQNNILVKKGMDINYKKYGSPIIINAKSLKIKQSDLISILNGKKQLFEIKSTGA